MCVKLTTTSIRSDGQAPGIGQAANDSPLMVKSYSHDLGGPSTQRNRSFSLMFDSAVRQHNGDADSGRPQHFSVSPIFAAKLSRLAHRRASAFSGTTELPSEGISELDRPTGRGGSRRHSSFTPISAPNVTTQPPVQPAAAVGDEQVDLKSIPQATDAPQMPHTAAILPQASPGPPRPSTAAPVSPQAGSPSNKRSRRLSATATVVHRPDQPPSKRPTSPRAKLTANDIEIRTRTAPSHTETGGLSCSPTATRGDGISVSSLSFPDPIQLTGRTATPRSTSRANKEPGARRRAASRGNGESLADSLQLHHFDIVEPTAASQLDIPARYRNIMTPVASAANEESTRSTSMRTPRRASKGKLRRPTTTRAGNRPPGLHLSDVPFQVQSLGMSPRKPSVL